METVIGAEILDLFLYGKIERNIDAVYNKDSCHEKGILV